MTCIDCGTPTVEGPAPAGKAGEYPTVRSKRLDELNWQEENEVVEDAEEEGVGEIQDEAEEAEEVEEYERLTPVDTSIRHCPHCGSEYQDWVGKCLDCGALLEAGPAPAGDMEANPEDIEEEIETADLDKAEGKSKAPINPNYKGKLILVAAFKINPNVNIKELVSGLEADIKENLLNEEGIRVYHNRTEYLNIDFLEFYVEEEQADQAIKILADYDRAQTEEKQKDSPKDTKPNAERASTSQAKNTATPELIKDKLAAESGLGDRPGPNPGEPLAVTNSALPQNHISRPLPVLHNESKQTEEDKIVSCPMCSSTDLEVRSSIFSSKINLKCRRCGSKWQA